MNYSEQIISDLFALGRIVREQRPQDQKKGVPSFMQIEIMKRLDEEKGFTMTALSQFLCIKAPSVTSFVDELLSMKLVKRVSHPNDRRVTRIMLTPKGKQVLDQYYPLRAPQFRKAIEHLSVANQKTLMSILHTIHQFADTLNKNK